jgi:hypothetical protein
MNRSPFLYVFFCLFVSCCSLALFSVGGHYAFGALFSFEEVYEPGSMIAGVDISGKTEAQALELVEEQVATWKTKQKVNYVLLEEHMILPLDVIDFDIEQALIDAKSGGKVELQAVIDEKQIRNELMKIKRYDLMSKVDTSLLKQELEEDIRSLATSKRTYDMNDFFREEKKLEMTTVAEVLLDGGEASYFAEWVAALDGYVIEPLHLFALQDALKQQGVPVFTSSGLDILATGFYQLFMQTNFDLLERHTSLTLPYNTTVGYAAAMSPNSMDLKVLNPNYYAYEVEASYQSGLLNLALQGKSFIHSYSLEVENVEQINPRTIVQYSNRRLIGDKQLMKTGSYGFSADVYRVERDENGVVVKKEKIASDFYPPEHRIEEWSLQQDHVDDQVTEEDSSLGRFPNESTPSTEPGNNDEEDDNSDVTSDETQDPNDENEEKDDEDSIYDRTPVKGEE